MEEKKCSICGKIKPLSSFGKWNYKHYTHRPECRKCRKYVAYSESYIISVMYNTQKSNSRKRGHPEPSYTLDELREWVLSQPIFNILYNNWVISGFRKNLKPSCDRKNNSKPYTFSNIMLSTWGENNYRGWCFNRGEIA